MELYVHNWGNEQAKRAWACAWALWRVLEPKLNALYHAAEHADHVALDRPAFWCDECNHKSVARS
jgi:predicted amidohydrolase YtcJ